MERLKERLGVARHALISLVELVVIEHPSRIERDATIQRFEYTCEAVWKAVAWMERSGIQGIKCKCFPDCIRATTPKLRERSDRQTPSRLR